MAAGPTPDRGQAGQEDRRSGAARGGDVSRRTLLGVAVAAAVTGGARLLQSSGRRPRFIALRPPGALPEEAFLGACVRCYKCADACPNDCIRFHGIEAGLHLAFTPYIRARERGCILCGLCAEACPTGALEPFEATREGWKAGVRMGVARVNESMCYSYNMRTCGACYRACPLAGEAITIGVFEQPTVHPDKCVGCGLCEQACLHIPQAIRVFPRRV